MQVSDWSHVKVVTVNPGFVNSNIWRGSSLCMKCIYRLVCLTTEQGSDTSVFAAVSSSIEGGEYVSPYYVPDNVLGKYFDMNGE